MTGVRKLEKTLKELQAEKLEPPALASKMTKEIFASARNKLADLNVDFQKYSKPLSELETDITRTLEEGYVSNYRLRRLNSGMKKANSLATVFSVLSH